MDGGFVILAGDKRSDPILAFSDKNKFLLNSEIYPSGLVDWLYNSKEVIEELRTENGMVSDEIKLKWDYLLNGNGRVIAPANTNAKIDPPEPDCTPTLIQKGPYLQTTWGQWTGFNDLCPLMYNIFAGIEMPVDVCPPGETCCRPPTGCVATAMAQIMRFHQFPGNYNWGSMPNASGSMETARLMRDIGDAVNMDYGCNGSSADTKNEVASSFRNDFGYSSCLLCRLQLSDSKKRIKFPARYIKRWQEYWLVDIWRLFRWPCMDM